MPPAVSPAQRFGSRKRPTSSPAALAGMVTFGAAGFTLGYLLSTAVQALVRSEILSAYGERRRHREMSKLRDHYIIRGAGRVGLRIVRERRRAGRAPA